MTVGNFIKKGIMPLLLIGILTWLGQYIYMVECIKVYPGGKLEIIFGGGYLVEESV